MKQQRCPRCGEKTNELYQHEGEWICKSCYPVKLAKQNYPFWNRSKKEKTNRYGR